MTDHRSSQTYPLSFAQEWWWILTSDGFGGYDNTVDQWRVTGPFDAGALERAVTELVRRHDLLRSALVLSEDGSTQEVHEHVTAAVTLAEIPPETPETSRPDALATTAGELAARRLDLREPPLLRVNLISVSPTDHLVQILVPRIVSDAQTMSVIARDLMALYDSVITGGKAELPDLKLTYGQVSVAERIQAQDGTFEGKAAHWRVGLQTDVPPAGVVTAVRPSHDRAPCDEVRFHLDHDTAEAVRHSISRLHMTPFIMFLTAFKMLFVLGSGRGDIAVGAAMANRRQVGSGDIVGCFSNPVVLRTDLARGGTIAESLARVRTSMFQALERQDLPFLYLLRSLRANGDIGEGRTQSDHDLYRLAFALYMSGENTAFRECGGATWVRQRTSPDKRGSMRTHLKAEVGYGSDSIGVRFAYRSDICGSRPIEALAEEYKAILARVAGSPTSSW